MKTALQELIGLLKDQKRNIPVQSYQKGLEYSIEAAERLLEKEKQMIVDSFKDGCDRGCESDYYGSSKEWDQYYQDKYGNK